MERYGKINPDTGYLMTCDEQFEADWQVLSTFAVDAQGEHYEFYINATTPDLVKSVGVQAVETINDIQATLRMLTVNYGGHVYYADSFNIVDYYKRIYSLSNKDENATNTVATYSGVLVALHATDFRNIIALAEAVEAKAFNSIPVVTVDSTARKVNDIEYFTNTVKADLPLADATVTSVKAALLHKDQEINKIENLYVTQVNTLHKLITSLDGKMPRRLTDKAIKAQQDAHALYQLATTKGIIVEDLTDAQKLNIATTVGYNTLLSKLCDQLTEHVRAGTAYKVLYDKVKAIDLDIKDLNEINLTALYTEFGITK